MNRENAGAKPTAPPRMPPEAEQEILEALFEGMEIHSSEIAAILKKHGVCGDVEALQDSYGASRYVLRSNSKCTHPHGWIHGGGRIV